MNVELEIAEALSRSNQRVEDDALLAKIEIARHAERAMDELAVKVGWMIRPMRSFAGSGMRGKLNETF